MSDASHCETSVAGGRHQSDAVRLSLRLGDSSHGKLRAPLSISRYRHRIPAAAQLAAQNPSPVQMEETDNVALARAKDSSKAEGNQTLQDDQPTSNEGRERHKANANTHTSQEDNEVKQGSRVPNDNAPVLRSGRPHASVISEFDPFASPSTGPGHKAENRTLSSSLGNPSGTTNADKLNAEQTPSVELSSNAVAQAPRKQAQKTQQGSFLSTTDASSDSPSADRQKQSRAKASTTAEQEHRHASAMVTDGESRTNTKPKELAFDFQGFLSQLRTRQAEPIQKYLKR